MRTLILPQTQDNFVSFSTIRKLNYGRIPPGCCCRWISGRCVLIKSIVCCRHPIFCGGVSTGTAVGPKGLHAPILQQALRMPVAAGLHLPEHNANSTKHAKRGDSPQHTTLPWEAFLPTRRDSGTRCRPDLYNHHRSNNTDFKDLLSEGKKRLEKAGQEKQLRALAEVVGGMAGCELEDLLADLCEPSFSRRQNE